LSIVGRWQSFFIFVQSQFFAHHIFRHPPANGINVLEVLARICRCPVGGYTLPGFKVMGWPPLAYYEFMKVGLGETMKLPYRVFPKGKKI
jgi:hypothetical protein